MGRPILSSTGTGRANAGSMCVEGISTPYLATPSVRCASAVAQHDQSGNAEIGMVQVALVHRTVAHASARVLAMHDEIHQSLLVDAHVLYPSCCIVSCTQDHHGRQRPPRVAQIALLLRTSVQTAAIHLAVVQPRCYALGTARSTTQLLRITAVHLVQYG